MSHALLVALLWFSAALSIFGCIAAILMIGKPRKASTPGQVLIVLMLNGLVIWGSVWAAVTLS